jgi:Putative metallopeptidase
VSAWAAAGDSVSPGQGSGARLRIGLWVLAASLAAPVWAAEHGDFITSYQRPSTSDYDVYYTELRRERFLESVAEELNRTLEPPTTVTLRIAECGHSTTMWVADTRTVTLCYEFLDAVVVIAGDAAPASARVEQLFSGAVTFALFNEVGRALVGLYGLPAPQGLDRVGDEFAALTLAAAEQDADQSAAAAIDFFDYALQDPDSGFEYLETHAFTRARLETVACILYGNAPGNHADVVRRGILSPERAPRCAEDVVAVAKFWDRYLKDHSRLLASPAPAMFGGSQPRP